MFGIFLLISHMGIYHNGGRIEKNDITSILFALFFFW